MRLIDLYNPWLEQYAGETNLFGASDADAIAGRLRRLEGYLSDTAIAVLPCSRSPADWASQSDPWHALAQLLSRFEAEFSGRLLIGREDVIRYRSEPADALTWGILAVSGFDALVREPVDLDRLVPLCRRGVRVFQLLSRQDNVLGGSCEPGDDRGLSPLGLAFLDRLAEIASSTVPRTRLLLDLAGQNTRTIRDVLDWISADPGRADSLVPIHTHGAGKLIVAQDPVPLEILGRLRATGGIVAIDPDASIFKTPGELEQAIKRIGSSSVGTRHAYDGVAISTNYLGLDHIVTGLDGVERLTRWLSRSFDPEIAVELIAGNARHLLERMVRVDE